jgi:hypothetical protein
MKLLMNYRTGSFQNFTLYIDKLKPGYVPGVNLKKLIDIGLAMVFKG